MDDKSQLIIRAANAGDLPAIAAIQAASPEAAQWSPSDYLGHTCLVAEKEGQVAGFLIVRAVGPGEWEILNLAVAPAERHSGIARSLLSDAMARQGVWFLEVRASNTSAIRVYEGLGFRSVGRRKNYYYDPSEDCIVMRFFS